MKFFFISIFMIIKIFKWCKILIIFRESWSKCKFSQLIIHYWEQCGRRIQRPGNEIRGQHLAKWAGHVTRWGGAFSATNSSVQLLFIVSWNLGILRFGPSFFLQSGPSCHLNAVRLFLDDIAPHSRPVSHSLHTKPNHFLNYFHPHHMLPRLNNG